MQVAALLSLGAWEPAFNVCDVLRCTGGREPLGAGSCSPERGSLGVWERTFSSDTLNGGRLLMFSLLFRLDSRGVKGNRKAKAAFRCKIQTIAS